MNEWFSLFVGGLAVYRLALLISRESGPMYIFRKLRRLPPEKSSAKEGLSCIWCVSVWLAAPVTAYQWWIDQVPVNLTPLHWLAISSLAIFANQQFTKGSL